MMHVGYKPVHAFANPFGAIEVPETYPDEMAHEHSQANNQHPA